MQLPFPSQDTPLPELVRYYDLYEAEYRAVLPEYFLGDGDLWEMPLWVAHLDAAIGRDDTTFLDLSRSAPEAEGLGDELLEGGDDDRIYVFSPLAQNFELAVELSRALRAQGRRTAIGGNMADLASEDDFTWIYIGLARGGVGPELADAAPGRVGLEVRRGMRQAALGYRPRYRLLDGFGARVPLVRLNASHGCLFGCTFCGDAWSRQLHEVPRDLLRDELAELREAFPDARTLYIGDKTFGQSRAAVENLLEIVDSAFGYRVIVQTHVAMVKPWLLDAMEQLGVTIVEMGFETANSEIIEQLRKGRRGDQDILESVHAIRERGMRPVLNVLGGLPHETAATQQEQLQFLRDSAEDVWLYNLYNFVPYPKTPLFPLLRDRIVDWDFASWREDRPVVYEPYHQTRESAWEHFLQLVDLASDQLRDRV